MGYTPCEGTKNPSRHHFKVKSISVAGTQSDSLRQSGGRIQLCWMVVGGCQRHSDCGVAIDNLNNNDDVVFFLKVILCWTGYENARIEWIYPLGSMSKLERFGGWWSLICREERMKGTPSDGSIKRLFEGRDGDGVPRDLLGGDHMLASGHAWDFFCES